MKNVNFDLMKNVNFDIMKFDLLIIPLKYHELLNDTLDKTEVKQ